MDSVMPKADEPVELRGMCPAEVIGVLDAVSASNKESRMTLVNRVLLEWTRERTRQARAINNILRDSTFGAGE